MINKNNFIKASKRATCGITEREINVPSTKHRSTVMDLKKKGYYIVGDNVVPGGMKRKNVKIWFTTGPGI